MAHRTRLAVIVVTALLAAQPRPLAAVLKTYSGGTGLWTDGTKWDPAGTPQVGDDVTIASGAVGLGVDTTIATLTLSGGALTGSGTLTVSGLVTWTAGSMSGSGTTVATAGMALGGSSKTLDQRTVVLSAGTAEMNANGSAISMQNGATFTNQGTFVLSNDGGLTNTQGFFDGGGSGTFNNQGTLRKPTTGNSGTSRFSGVAMNNTGTVDVQAGTLLLGGGGTHSGATFVVTAPAVLDFGGSTHMLDATCSITGSGSGAFGGGTTTHLGRYDVSGGTQVRGGSVTFSGPVSAVGDLEISSGAADFSGSSAQIPVGSLVQSGGTLTGGNTLIVTGPASWTAGTMSGSGTTVMMAGMALGGTSKTLNQRTLVLSGGTAAMNANVSFISMRNGATFTNQGTFEFSNDGGLANNQGFFDGGSGSGAFNNHGTLRKVASGNTGTSRFSGIAVTNTGVVDVQAAALSFSGGFTQTAGTTRLSGGTLISTTPIMINGGRLDGIGTVQGDVSSSGDIGPGLSAGALQIEGTYTQTATGALTVEIGGAANTQFDRLTVGGAATLAGTLHLRRIDGFVPTLGQRFEVMTFASRTGTIPTLTGGDLGGGLAFEAIYGATNLIVQVVPGSGGPTPTPTATMTPTATITQAGTATPTRVAPVTATATATPGDDIAISGRVLVAGPNGLTAGQNLPVAGFGCESRGECLANPGAPLGQTVTSTTGEFTLDIPADVVQRRIMLLIEAVVGGVRCRLVLTPDALSPSAAPAVPAGEQGPADVVTVDPVSEAAVRLLDAAGLENYDDDGVNAVIAAVRDANAGTDFAGLSAEAANDTAERVAASDPTVQMVRQANRLSCVGDCDGSATVEITELIRAVNIALDALPVQSCQEVDANLDGRVAVNELVAAVNSALSGCQ